MSTTEYNFTPEDRKTINAAIEEAVDSKIQQESEAQFCKDVATRMKEELGLKPADFNALVKERLSNDVSSKIYKFETILELNEELKAKP